MNFVYNKKLESRNFIDGIDFTRYDSCIWNVYPAGAAGDLLTSIINFHYGQTGSNYYGIDSNGQVIFRPSDYKITNVRHQNRLPLFDETHFFEIANSLGDRNLNYSILDQFIFSCHLYKKKDIEHVLSTFPKCKIICTYIKDSRGQAIVKFMSNLKNKNMLTDLIIEDNKLINNELVIHPNVLNIPFGGLFQENSYYDYYDQIINFLNLNGRLICFDYIEYYLSKQHHDIKDQLINYIIT